MAKPLKHFILDVDGVFTSGQFLYTQKGKYAKVFGPHDNDGIKLIRQYLNVEAISADKRGWEITKKRIADDMQIKLTLVSEEERLDYFLKSFAPQECAYMGDGLHDIPIFQIVQYSIAPQSAFPLAKNAASYVTSLDGGNGAVAEACLHLAAKYFHAGPAAVTATA